jgi:hypothetical protein
MMGRVVTADTRRKVSQTKTGMVFLPKEGFARGYQPGFAGLEYQGNANGSEAYAKGYAEARANSERMAWLRTHSRTEGCGDARSSMRGRTDGNPERRRSPLAPIDRKLRS